MPWVQVGATDIHYDDRGDQPILAGQSMGGMTIMR
jgi:hypothetical protein